MSDKNRAAAKLGGFPEGTYASSVVCVLYLSTTLTQCLGVHREETYLSFPDYDVAEDVTWGKGMSPPLRAKD
ncbi:hypothetical protein MRX96_034731 [Rhipicephalus microplus]